ncbi:MAG: hypothetical protein GKR94_21440 [Gammaproteobacteria bacterium]|nr:hypothetical protein [Gammaproteobacteria bacterium]
MSTLYSDGAGILGNTRKPARPSIGLLAALCGALVASAIAVDATEGARPLLMDNKTTLYKRVLTRPGAVLEPCRPPLDCLQKKSASRGANDDLLCLCGE